MKSWIVTLLCSWPMLAFTNTQVWVDVASQEEYAIEHLHNAIHIPYTYIARGVSARYPDKNTVIKLYGRGQLRGQQASQALQALGYHAASHAGALAELKATGLTTQQARPIEGPMAADDTISGTAALYLNTPNTAPY
ncbi:rhodanese-like domain-containing protein [Oceanisphaera pacifica]|uniref:Rhodanese-like domain-containing protein n=1 Tax=Oceanisphaera pacifica TaxID=2818389 RepID=A0ABS3NDC0_9GAMM|nr:rhodanese-like domain-containing protein [Oceanisphaera pacifica]MBO1518593.1 rhodanese-like domain-containing protein [Oceanisphaera pacifica]